MSEIVVDTSIWIDFFSGKPVPALEEALARRAVVISPVVASELVSGARRPRDRANLVDFLNELPWHETPRAHWLDVGDLRRLLQTKGLTVSTPDAHVARCALDRDATLLSRDRVFERIASHRPLRLAPH